MKIYKIDENKLENIKRYEVNKKKIVEFIDRCADILGIDKQRDFLDDCEGEISARIDYLCDKNDLTYAEKIWNSKGPDLMLFGIMRIAVNRFLQNQNDDQILKILEVFDKEIIEKEIDRVYKNKEERLLTQLSKNITLNISLKDF